MRRALALGAVLALAPLPAIANRGHGTPSEERLDCIAHWESERGEPLWEGYDDGGRYEGRYQFDRSTARGVVTRIGREDLAHVRAERWPWEVQDEAARQLHRERGLQPWPTPARRCA